jgi:hypothetical protein
MRNLCINAEDEVSLKHAERRAGTLPKLCFKEVNQTCFQNTIGCPIWLGANKKPF